MRSHQYVVLILPKTIYYHIPSLFWIQFTIMVLITFKLCLFSFDPHPPQIRKKRKCIHPEYAEQGWMAIFPLAEVVTWSGWGMCQPSPLTSSFPPPAHPKPRHSTAVSLSYRGKGPGQESSYAAQCQSSRSSEGGGGTKVCVCFWKRGGGMSSFKMAPNAS